MSRNFKDYEEEMERDFPPPRHIRENVQQNLGVFRFIGNIVELYVPRLFDLFIKMSGGDAPTEPPPQGPIGPGPFTEPGKKHPPSPPNLS